MQLCTVDDVKNWILQDYLNAAVSLNASIVEDTIASASSEIIELVSCQYSLDAAQTSSLLCNMAAVFSAYRIMSAITGIVSTDGSSNNAWLPLQKEYRRMDALLQDIAKGTIKLSSNAAATSGDTKQDPALVIVTKPQELDLSKF